MSTQDSIQKFYRVYIPNVTDDDMNLPFCWDDISVTPLPRKVTVKSVSSGNVWRMEMTTNDESDTVFLRDGWKKVVKDENLKEPTFLVFEFDGSREFHFCVYEHGSMCKRMRSQIEKEVIQVESDEEEESKKTNEDDDDDDDEGSDDDYMFVEDEESTEGVDESPKRKERGGTSKRRSYLKIESDTFEEHLENKLNPTFLINTTRQQTRIPAAVIKDYNLKFPKEVTVCDKLGKLKRKISVWNNRTVILNGFRSIVRRNHVRQGDKVVCELMMVDGHQGLVHEVKVHIIKG